MLRVGLTGGLGSGKSTVAAMLKERGAYVLSADEIGRKLMEPGQDVWLAILQHFGEAVVRTDGTLDRAELARIAFVEGRVEELNAIVHPATIALQEKVAAEIARRDAHAIVVVESALIFESKHGAGWRQRFDKVVLVTAAEELKIARYAARAGGDVAAAEAEARRRLAQMIPDAEKIPQCDYVIWNDGTLAELAEKVDALWADLGRDSGIG